MPDVERVVLAGLSTRAAAASAARAGYAVTAVDGFADLDQHPAVHALEVPGRFTATAAARIARTAPGGAVAYLSGFEHAPSAVAMLAAGRALWGNTPDTLRRVRHPATLAETLRREGLHAPEVSGVPRADGVWLLKPVRSGGGHGIRPWTGGHALPRGTYLQAFVEGRTSSVQFVASGGRAVALGLTRQLVGDAAFGATGFTWCGGILEPAPDDALMRRAMRLAHVLARAFDLRGVNGVDVMDRDGELVPLEVNPRWTGALELVERADGTNLFAVHAGACVEGRLPTDGPRRRTVAVGKAIVFARHDVLAPDTRAWLTDATVADVPHPGEHVAAGRPFCSVFAEGPDVAACRDALVRRAAQVYASLVPAHVAGATR